MTEIGKRRLRHISTGIFIVAALAGIGQFLVLIFTQEPSVVAQSGGQQEVCQFNNTRTKIICGGGFADSDGARAYDFSGGSSAAGDGYGTGSRPGETYGFLTREDGAICVVRSNASNVDLICS